MQKYILSQNVLSDNELLLADENEMFKGGYVAILKRFKKRELVFEYLNKNYPEIEIFN